MSDDNLDEFKADIVKQVRDIVNAQSKNNQATLMQFNDDIGRRLEVTLPSVLNKTAPKYPLLFNLLVAVVNGVVVGLTIYAAAFVSAQ